MSKRDRKKENNSDELSTQGSSEKNQVASKTDLSLAVDIRGVSVPMTVVVDAAKKRLGLTDESWEEADQQKLIDEELLLARGQVPQVQPSEVELSGDQVQVTVPKAFNLRLGKDLLRIPAGIQMVSSTIANHKYAKANGMKPYSPEPITKS